MTEYIKREDAITKFQELKNKCESLKDAIYLDGVMAVLDTLPAADVAEVRHAFWSDYGSGVCCTNCGISLFHQDENNNWGIEPSKFSFCPSCGARMDKEEGHEAD